MRPMVRHVWAKLAWIILSGILVSCPMPASAQTGDGYGVELVEIWIRGHVSPQRAWSRDLSRVGIAFEVTADVEARLREAGADDEWIRVLRQSQVRPPGNAAAVLSQRPFNRHELRPLYFGNDARISPYVGVMQLRQTGGEVSGYSIATSRGLARLQSAPLPELSRTYGLLVDFRSGSLDLEGAFERDLRMLNLGLKYQPFLPFGTSGVRALVGVKPFVGITRQTLARFAREAFDEQEPVVDLVNGTYGADISAGLAYHWRPGAWVFSEVSYRVTSTLWRELRLPDQAAAIEDGIPWSKWSAKGLMFRAGVGF